MYACKACPETQQLKEWSALQDNFFTVQQYMCYSKSLGRWKFCADAVYEKQSCLGALLQAKDRRYMLEAKCSHTHLSVHVAAAAVATAAVINEHDM